MTEIFLNEIVIAHPETPVPQDLTDFPLVLKTPHVKRLPEEDTRVAVFLEAQRLIGKLKGTDYCKEDLCFLLAEATGEAISIEYI